MKRKIRVKFVDFYRNFDPENTVFMECLRKHYDVEYSDDPEYLFFSGFGMENLDYSNCVKIFYTGENHFPDFNICDYAIGFEWMNVSDRYLRFTTLYQTLYKEQCALMENRENFTEEDLKNKTGFCSYVYSNAGAAKIRTDILEKLSEYKQVSSGGRYRNNIGGPCEDKVKFESAHKFSIAFENTEYPGYSTEKLMQAFAAHTIPIYWGDPKVTKIFNPKAFIHVRDYENLDQVLEYVKELDQDDEKYMAMMKEPAFVSPDLKRENMLKKLDEFLVYIIDQDFESAKRFNRICWNKYYLSEYIARRDAYEREKKSLICRAIKKAKKIINKEK